MKFETILKRLEEDGVAPYAGAWIEILEEVLKARNNHVAPYAGAWIEIGYSRNLSHPFIVAPYAGAWIEITRRVSSAPSE